jgi:G2/mitotic-specific cyclin-B, other
MDSRIFGKDVTNLADHDLHRYKRNYSFLHNERLRDLSLNHKHPNVTARLNNKTHL